MSEVTGPPQFKGLDPVIRVPEINKHDQKPDDQKPAHEQKKATTEQGDQATNLTRDPAVSLSASVGHIALGENIEGSILSIDGDGRPILITEDATFTLTPDVGLKEGDSVTLNIVTTEHKLIAELTFRNGKPEEPPVLLSLTLVSVKQIPHGTLTTPLVDSRYIDSQTGAYIPPPTASNVTPSTPQTSLSSGIYQQSSAPEVGVASAVTPDSTIKERAPLPLESQKSLKDKISTETKQLSDPTMIKASTTDMATLLMTQQIPEKPSGDAPQIETTQTSQSGAALSNVPTNENANKVANVYQSNDQAKESSRVEASTATMNADPLPPPAAPTSFPVLRAEFRPSDAAQAFLTKANISTTKPSIAVEVVLRAKQKSDPANTIEVKILSAQEKTAPEALQVNKPSAQHAEKPSDVSVSQNTQQNEIKDQPRVVHLETTGGTVEISLPHSEALPSPNNYIAIIPATYTYPPVAQTAPSPTAIMPLSLLAKGLTKWPALQKTYELITKDQQKRTFVPGIIQQINQALGNRTAGGGARLANSLLFMMAALKQGDVRSWLGPKVEQYLEQTGQKHLLNILKQDIKRFASLINRPASGEWQPIVLPLAADDNSPLLALLIRPEQQNQNEKNQNGDNGEGDDAAKENPTRFILEVHLSQLGEIQLDGFIKDKNFELKFKSLTPLAQAMKNDVRALFSSALDASGYSGSITFYDLPIFSVNVTDIINNAEPLPHEMHNA